MTFKTKTKDLIVLTLLRKIRRSLIHSNSTKKYLLYAIGEIALVVIGILIALQINNWNEEQKDRQFERNILSEFREDLVLDTLWFQGRLDRIDGIIEALEKLESMPEWSDSMYLWLDLAGDEIYMQVNTGSLETLKSVGMNYIRNDELRRYIVRFYQRAEMNLDVINQMGRDVDDQWKIFTKDHFLLERVQTELGVGRRVPINYKDLKTNPKYQQILVYKMLSLESRGERIKRHKMGARSLIAAIDEYLLE